MDENRFASSVLILLLTFAAAGAQAQTILAPTKYQLTFAIDYDAEFLRATAVLTLENPSDTPVREVSLLLYRLLRVKSIRGVRELPFTQTVAAFEDYGKQQVNHIVATLPEPLAPHTQTTLAVQYEGYLLGYAETGMRYIQDHIDPAFTILRHDSYAYPQPGLLLRERNRREPMRDFTYSARITVPKGLTVANGGRSDGVEVSGDLVTFGFSSHRPSWRMDFAIADYEQLSGPSVRVYCFPADRAGAVGVAEAAAQSLDLFIRWFGPQPDKATLTFIEIPDGWGSQADVTTVVQTAAAFRDPSRVHEVYHEISHLWNVPATDLPSPRWNEGLASFLENLVGEQLGKNSDSDARANHVVTWLRDGIANNPGWESTPLVDYGRADLTDLSYSVGHVFFDLLYRIAGRETFNAIIREFVTQFKEGGSTNDLIAVVTNRAGAGVADLVSDWIYTTGWTQRVQESAGIRALEAYYRRAGAMRRQAAAPTKGSRVD